MKPTHIMLSLALLGSSVAADAAPLERIGEPVLNGKRLPFSGAVRVGDVLFLSGQIGIRPDNVLPQEFDAQVRQAMDNVAGVLKQAGVGWGDVAKCTVMLDDMAKWPAFNALYVGYFPDEKFPARSAFGADGLALGAAVEIECIARAPAK